MNMKKFFNYISLLLIITIITIINCPIYTYAEELGENGTEVGETVTEGESGEEKEDEPVIEETKSNDASLKKVSIEKVDGDLNTDLVGAGNNTYTATVKSNVKKVKIVAEANDSNAKIHGDEIGEVDLNIGVNTFKFSITAEDGVTSLYYIVKITRATDNIVLTKLGVTGGVLNEIFDSTINNYSLTVDYNVTGLTFNLALADGVVSYELSSDSNVGISKNVVSNLEVGTTVVKIALKNEAGETNEYSISIVREEEEIQESELSGVVSDIIENTNSELVIPPVVDNNDDSDDNNGIDWQKISVIAICVLLIVIAGVGIFFFVRNGNNDKKIQKKIAKLKKKQDKIEKQLTGLIPIVTEEQVDEYISSNESKNENEDIVISEDTVDDNTIVIEPDNVEKNVFIEEVIFEDTIEMDPIIEDEIEDLNKSFDEDLDDLFLDE